MHGCLDRKPGELSGGQRRRLALGRALVRRPQVLLLDEPLSNFDAPVRRELRRELPHLHRELALTILYVMHDQVEAMALGRRVAVMNHGAIKQVGPPEELRARPAAPFVAAFLDPSPLKPFIADDPIPVDQSRLENNSGLPERIWYSKRRSVRRLELQRHGKRAAGKPERRDHHAFPEMRKCT